MSKAKVSWLLCIGRLVSKTDNVMHFACLVEQASATGFLRPICLSQTWSITDLVATYLSMELTPMFSMMSLSGIIRMYLGRYLKSFKALTNALNNLLKVDLVWLNCGVTNASMLYCLNKCGLELLNLFIDSNVSKTSLSIVSPTIQTDCTALIFAAKRQIKQF